MRAVLATADNASIPEVVESQEGISEAEALLCDLNSVLRAVSSGDAVAVRALMALVDTTDMRAKLAELMAQTNAGPRAV